MKNLIIVCAGGFGREVMEWSFASEDFGKYWNIKGFLDDAPRERLKGSLRVSLLGPIASYQIEPDDVFICGIGIPRLRRKFQEMLISRGAEFISVIHPTATVCASATIGIGVVICPYALISADAAIGDGSVIYYHSSVDHDVSVGRFCQISGHCDVTGGAELGDEVFLGSHSVILPGVKVEDSATIGAGAVVTKNVRAGAVVYGVPAHARIAEEKAN